MEINMKRLNLLLFTIMVFSVLSCKYDLVPESISNGSQPISTQLSDSITPPENLKVSQGYYRSIELNWNASKDAVQYQIFSSSSPYDNFIQEGETAGKETTFTIADEDPGITKYYLVKAVNHLGNVSRGSKIVSGTTLDVPIITDITPTEEGTSVKVQWWMGNCSKQTYENDVEYTIAVYTQSRATVPFKVEKISGSTTSCVIGGLSPKTDYCFTVEATILSVEQKSEVSDITNAQTAHKIIPHSVENLKASKGTNNSEVIIEWNIPDFVDYFDKTTRIYSLHPVYFTVERKLLESDDKSYEVLSSYIGSVLPEGLKFNCENNTTSSPTISVEKNDNGEINPQYQGYIPGSKITYKDKTAEKGKQYTYRITSYTDDVGATKISSENSIATENGWKISEPTFKAESTMNTADEKITSITVSFILNFNDFKQYFIDNEIDYPYAYAITYQKTLFSQGSVPPAPEVLLYTVDSLSELSEKKYVFSNPEQEESQGYYTFKLYIYSSSIKDPTTIPAEFFRQLDASNKVTVTDDITMIPKIENFKVTDGYSNKYELSWDVLNDTVYTIYWTDYENGEPVDSDSKVLTEGEDYTVSESKASFTHLAESGNARLYTLNALKNGIPDNKEYESISKTLGTASPVMAKPDYKKITVSWPAVQMANTDYEIHAAYHGGESVLSENYEITTENGIVTTVINEPLGFDDIKKSGLPIDFTVTAKNTDTGDSTSKVITVRTLGPALINTRTNPENIQEKTLSVSWDNVEGATGYIIYRTKYNYNESYTDWNFERADYYFYDVTSEKLTESGNEVSSLKAKIVFKNNCFTLTDYDCDITDKTSTYEKNQSQISWGLPFGYVVLPVNGGNDDFIFGSDSNYLKVTDGKAKVSYTGSFADEKISTYGYGLNVSAAKSESAASVRVEWAKPYNPNLIPALYKMPYNKEADHDYGASWTLVKVLAQGTTHYDDVLPVDDISSAFVYAIQYQAPKNSRFTASYRENLLTVKDSRYSSDYEALNVPPESQNKGYLLTLKDFEAVYGGEGSKPGEESYYQENVNWANTWDYEERALGPDSFTICIKNRNLSSTMDWSKVVASVTVTDGVFSKPTPSTEYTDTLIGALNSGITLKPKGLTEGTATETNDILKVLRDAKHYYSVSLTRGEQEPVMQAADHSIYTYRQISPEELCKCVGLIIADSLYKCGVPNRKTYSTSGHTGDFKLACSTGTTDANRVQWQCSDYTNKYTKACSTDTMGSLNSFLTLNSTTSSFDEKGIYGETLYYLPELEIEVKCDDEIQLSSYEGKVTVTAAGCSWSIVSTPSNLKYNLSMKINGSQVIDISNNKTEMYRYLPYDFGSKHENPDSTVNTSLQTYQGEWWN